MSGTPPLHESLLHAGPASVDRRPDSRWAYPLAGIAMVSTFLLYHLSVLLVWNAPSKDVAKRFHASFLDAVEGRTYFRATRNDQSWGMFAPNPDRSNNFVKVYVIDQNHDRWDFGQDIWALNRYPYAWYDRRGKVNRNIDGKKNYQRVYGAWVCREWERQHGGESPVAVQFIKRWTSVPEPDEVIAKGGWDPWAVEYKTIEQETVVCKKIAHGTLPNALRERYGLPALDDPAQFREVEIETWRSPPKKLD